jgi:hypothetical protein
MSIINKILICFSVILLSCLAPLAGKEDHRVEIQPTAFEKAITLSSQGILKQKENGFVYLDVSNAFVTEIMPLLYIEGRLQAIPTAARSVGAHISVFDEKENVVPVELGTPVSFQVTEVRSFPLHTRDGSKKLWVIAVESPQLENLRIRYGCLPKIKGHDFHITLGKQMPAAPENWQTVERFSTFNFSEEPVQGVLAEGDFVTVHHDEIFTIAAKVDAVGQLKLKNNGFVYLDVENRFIDDIWQMLPLQGAFDPVSTKAKQMGAHISVIHEDEMIGHEIWELLEAGEWFNFEVKELRYVDQNTSKGQTRLWLLSVDCPGLERLRQHYGLKPKLQGHDFHITIGSEKMGALFQTKPFESLEETFYPELEEAAA